MALDLKTIMMGQTTDNGGGGTLLKLLDGFKKSVFQKKVDYNKEYFKMYVILECIRNFLIKNCVETEIIDNYIETD